MSEIKIIDADVFDPIPVAQAKIGETLHPVVSLFALPYSAYLFATRIQEHVAELPDEQHHAKLVDLIAAFVPSAPREAFADWSFAQLYAHIERLISASTKTADPTPDQTTKSSSPDSSAS